MSPKPHRIAALGATVFAAAALAAPAAGEPSLSDGRFAPAPSTQSGSLPDGFRSPDSTDPTRTRPAPSQEPFVVVEAGSTFQWGDAAIGAAAALGLTLASVGGMLTVRRSRHSHAAQIAG